MLHRRLLIFFVFKRSSSSSKRAGNKRITKPGGSAERPLLYIKRDEEILYEDDESCSAPRVFRLYIAAHTLEHNFVYMIEEGKAFRYSLPSISLFGVTQQRYIPCSNKTKQKKKKRSRHSCSLIPSL